MAKFEGRVVIKKKKHSSEKSEFFRDYLLVYKKNLLSKNSVWQRSIIKQREKILKASSNF